MKFGDLAIFAKVGWDILENRVKCPEIHENESHLRFIFVAPLPATTGLGPGARKLVRGDTAGQTLQCTRAAAAGVPCPMREATLVRASFSTD
jgi:hypothetical protein